MISEMFYRIGDFLDYINNYIQFFLILFTILITLFFFMLPYIKPLKVLLGKIGLTNRQLIRTLWICYKNPRKHIRIFIELAIVKSKGQHQDRIWWSNFRRIFKRFLDDNENTNDYTTSVENAFDLGTTEFNELVKEYFDYFKRNKASDRFAIPHNEAVSFIINIEINEGYIVPITFITGLNDRYDEDWVKILSNFFTAFGEDLPPDRAILPQELYFTYNWLMWGPSYQIKYDLDKHKLIQYGFGDESNSVNLIVKNDLKGKEIWDMLCHDAEVSHQKKFGYNCSIKGKLFDTSEYYSFNNESIDPKSIPFLKRLSEDYLGIPYLFELLDFNIKTNLKAEHYFFSAYLWIMFGLNDENNPGFTPRKSLTLFEHANLADVQNYNFLAETLIDKCFKHFDEIAAHPEFHVRKYHYCLSMNSFIDKLFKERLNKEYAGNNGNWYKNNISIKTPYSIAEILDTFDNYFVSKEENYRIEEVKASNKETVKALCNYYAETYLEEFKAYPGSLNLDNLLFLLQENKEFKSFIILALDNDNQPLGCCVAFYFPELNCGYVDSIAVHKNYRNFGIGKRLLNHYVQIARQKAAHKHHHSLDFVLAPVQSFCFDSKTSKKYRFWSNNGFRPLNNTSEQVVWSVLGLNDEVTFSTDNDYLNTIKNKINHIKNSL